MVKTDCELCWKQLSNFMTGQTSVHVRTYVQRMINILSRANSLLGLGRSKSHSHFFLFFLPNMFKPVGETTSSEFMDFNLFCQFSPFWRQIITHSSLIIATLRLQKHMASLQNGCVSRCYWLIEMHLILNDQCPSEHFLVWCPNDRAAVTACFLMLVLWATYPHTITSSRSLMSALQVNL